MRSRSAQIAGHEGVESVKEVYSDAEAEDVLVDQCAATSEMDELQVASANRTLFIKSALKGVLDNFS